VRNLRLSPRRTAQEEAGTHAGQFQTALPTRWIIEQAKGYLARRVGITPQAALELLVEVCPGASGDDPDVSRRVVAGDLPMRPPPDPAGPCPVDPSPDRLVIAADRFPGVQRWRRRVGRRGGPGTRSAPAHSPSPPLNAREPVSSDDEPVG